MKLRSKFRSRYFIILTVLFYRFYLPHGIAIDHENNIWVTDVALHQVDAKKFQIVVYETMSSRI